MSEEGEGLGCELTQRDQAYVDGDVVPPTQICVSGPRLRDRGSEQVTPIANGATVGRTSMCTLILVDKKRASNEQRVSGKHGSFTLCREGLLIYTDTSANGTTLKRGGVLL